MEVLYFLALRLYFFTALVASFFSGKAKRWVQGQNQLWSGLENKEGNQKVFWMHCASVGEFEQGRPILERFRKLYPDWKIVLTFFSPSGYELRKNYPIADTVLYLPLDGPANSANFVRKISPDLVVFVKYEFWYFYFKELFKRKVPLFLVSVKLRRDQVFFKWYGHWFRQLLRMPDQWFVQDVETKNLLLGTGASNAEVAGDTRYDRVIEIASEAKEIERIKAFCAGKKVLVVGSNWKKDDDILIPVLKKELTDWKIIVAPHEIGTSQIRVWKESFSGNVTTWNNAAWNENEKRFFVLDTVGMLSSVYQYASMAYIGGGFGTGIHNILEPGIFHVPIVFGPKYDKFNEAKEFIHEGFALSVNGSEELKAALQKFERLTETEAEYRAFKDRMKAFFESHKGATFKIMNVLSEKIGKMNI